MKKLAILIFLLGLATPSFGMVINFNDNTIYETNHWKSGNRRSKLS